MTYIIAEPCIDIKDLSCVDVCPVDCIHQAERILVIDPEECIDCFAPTEEFITDHGLRTFAEMENKSCRVLTDDGFKPAYVRRFRRKPLVSIALVPAVSARPRRDGESYRLGVLHGLVFGDGSWNKQEIKSGLHLHYVQLYGEKVGKFRDFFDQVNFSPCLDVHPGYVGTGVVRSEANLKRLLPEDADSEYIAGFVDGWLAADGDQVKAGSWRLRSIDHEALTWLERVAPYAGYITIGSGE